MSHVVFQVRTMFCTQKQTQYEHLPDVHLPLCAFLWELEHMQWNLSPQAPQSATAPTSQGPLLAPYWPNCHSSTTPHRTIRAHIRAADIGLYWLVWDRPLQDSLLILAALPPSQEDNLLWLPSLSHLLALSLFLSFCLCFVNFHSTQLCCYMADVSPPLPPIPWLSFSHFLFF